ncbi:MAG: hypothetical protein HY055_11310 [Magnetospirillum sp.]|nr:hypothetical protein [Magnetospirillum sp.]
MAMAPLDCSPQANMAIRHKQISYRFFTGAAKPLGVDLFFDPKTFRLDIPAEAVKPDWTRLEHKRCPNCTLSDDCAYCPAALAIAQFLPVFKDCVSHDKAVVEVETGNRTIVSKTTLQAGLGSLIGLVCATSGCPLTRFLRPMARFHLPFADEQETLFRSFSSWLLSAIVAQRLSGSDAPVTLDGLKQHYSDLSVMNSQLALRMRDSVNRDAMLNAVIILDMFAMIAPENIDGGFEDILDAFTVEED